MNEKSLKLISSWHHEYGDFIVCDLGQILMIWEFSVVRGTDTWHMNYSLISVDGCLLVLGVLGSEIFNEQYWKLCPETLMGSQLA